MLHRRRKRRHHNNLVSCGRFVWPVELLISRPLPVRDNTQTDEARKDRPPSSDLRLTPNYHIIINTFLRHNVKCSEWMHNFPKKVWCLTARLSVCLTKWRAQSCNQAWTEVKVWMWALGEIQDELSSLHALFCPSVQIPFCLKYPSILAKT